MIQSLCRSDPAQAEEATVQFSNYLRGNMAALQTNAPIPFARKLDHWLYLSLFTLVIVVLTLRGLILFRLGRAYRRPFGRKRGRHEVY